MISPEQSAIWPDEILDPVIDLHAATAAHSPAPQDALLRASGIRKVYAIGGEERGYEVF